jgi:hypothetical protein
MAQSVPRQATGWAAGAQFPAEARDFSLLHRVQTALGPTQLLIKWVPGALSPGILKRPGGEADHLPPPPPSSWRGASLIN